MVRKKIIDFLSNISFVNNYFSGIATIFFLHRVYPPEKNKLFPNENMKVSPEFLEEFILKLKAKGYEFISIDRLYEILQNKEKVKKQIVFTLDDGYKDNYKIAYPIFKKYNTPFVIYLTTSFPERNAYLWWYVIEDILIENNEIILGSGQKFICKTKEQKNNIFLKIREMIKGFNKNEFQERLNNLLKNYKIDWVKKCSELTMDWEQIINISKDNLCTIGGHTKNHYALNRLSETEIIEEVMGANKIIESKIGKKVEHFSYPFGTRNEITKRESNIVKKLGFKTAAITRYGNIYPEHKNYLECLPRIMLTEGFDIKNVGKIRKK